MGLPKGNGIFWLGFMYYILAHLFLVKILLSKLFNMCLNVNSCCSTMQGAVSLPLERFMNGTKRLKSMRWHSEKVGLLINAFCSIDMRFDWNCILDEDFFPLNYNDLHWYMATVDMVKQKVIIFDFLWGFVQVKTKWGTVDSVVSIWFSLIWYYCFAFECFIYFFVI